MSAIEFGSEATPVSSHIIGTLGGIVSKSAAKQQGRLNGNSDLWDGAPRFSSPRHNKVYNPSGLMPDVVATSLYDEGLVPSPDVDAMWQTVQSESDSCRTNESAFVSLNASMAASALGKRGKGKKKTMSPACIEQRRLAGIASGFSRKLNAEPF